MLCSVQRERVAKMMFVVLFSVVVLLGGTASRPVRRLGWLRDYEEQKTRIFVRGHDAGHKMKVAEIHDSLSHNKNDEHCTNAATAPQVIDLSLATTNKPRLILHVGPSKSATTSLQTDLTSVQRDLEVDGYSYAGRYYNPYTNVTTGEYFLNRSETTLLTAAHTMLKHCDLEPRVECCRNFSAELKAYPHAGQQRNIILSEEPFGNQWQHVKIGKRFAMPFKTTGMLRLWSDIGASTLGYQVHATSVNERIVMNRKRVRGQHMVDDW